jgi:hypothetical protein
MRHLCHSAAPCSTTTTPYSLAAPAIACGVGPRADSSPDHADRRRFRLLASPPRSRNPPRTDPIGCCRRTLMQKARLCSSRHNLCSAGVIARRSFLLRSLDVAGGVCPCSFVFKDPHPALRADLSQHIGRGHLNHTLVVPEHRVSGIQPGICINSRGGSRTAQLRTLFGATVADYNGAGFFQWYRPEQSC